jgi:hypothetical protein
VIVEIATWVLRVFGALYLIAGLIAARQMYFWARIAPSINEFARVAEEFTADVEGREPRPPALNEDGGRSWWLFAGSLLLAIAGVAMLLPHWSAVPLLAAIIVHQLVYFIRQRRRELKAATPDAAVEARPNRATINGFFGGLIMAVLAAWLYYEGALH